MHTAILALSLLFAGPAFADTAESDCPTAEEICSDDPIISPEDEPTCVISEHIVLEKGCDLSLPSMKLFIAAEGSLTVEHDAEIVLAGIEIEARDTKNGFVADCGEVSCGEVTINSTGDAILRDMDLSAQVSGSTTGSFHGSSLRVVVSSGGDVTVDGLIDLNGKNGQGGSLFIAATNINLNVIITACGKDAAFNGIGGPVFLHAINNIVLSGTSAPALSDEHSRIDTRGDRAGPISLIAGGTIETQAHSQVISQSSDSTVTEECPSGCLGRVKLEATSMDLEGKIVVSKGNGNTTPGGSVWLSASDEIETKEDFEVELGGGRQAASGTLRVDADTIKFRGDVSGKGELEPLVGAVISMVARDRILVFDEANIDAAGNSTLTGALGGRIELVSLNSVAVAAGTTAADDGMIHTGSAAGSSILIHARNGQVTLAGIVSAGVLMDSTPGRIEVDGCVLDLVAPELLAGDTIELNARGQAGSVESPWQTGPLGDSITLQATTLLLYAPSTDRLPTDAAMGVLEAAAGLGSVTALVDAELKQCGDEGHEPMDLDGDGNGWDRLGSGPANYDCDDYDAAVYPFAPETLGDGVDSDCICDDSDLVHAYAAFLPRIDESIPLECDSPTGPITDADGGPGDADGGPEEEGVEPADDTGAASQETGSEPGPDELDTGLSSSTPFEGTAVKGCNCASTSHRPWPWFGALLAFGLIVRRRQ